MSLLVRRSRRPDAPTPAAGLWSAPGVALVVGLMALAYALAFSASSILSFRNFGMSAFDIGIHVQAIWKLSNGRGLFNTVRGLPIWGDHCWFFMVVYAPLYKLLPRVETLLVLQSVALASGALPLASIVLRSSRSRPAAVVFAAAWLLAPALQNMNLENYHPEVFAAPLLLWAIERALAGRWKGYAVAVGLALLCKEDVALTVFVLGLWVSRRSRRAGLLTMAGSVVWFVLCVKLLLPWFNQRGFFRFEGGYWFSELWRRRFDPSYYWQTIFAQQAVVYGWRLGSPSLFLFLASPLLAVAALPGFLVNVLSGNQYLASIDYHYNFQTLPVLYAAAALGWARVASAPGRPGRIAGRLVLAGLLLASAWANDRWSHLPARRSVERLAEQYEFFRDSGAEARFQGIAGKLPADPDVPISVSHNLLPHLANRSEVYMFPNPFRAVYWGIDGEGLPSGDRVQALLLDTHSADQAILARLLTTGEFRIEAEAGPLILARRVAVAARRPLADPRELSAPAEGIRLLAFLSDSPVTSLTPLVGRVPDVELTTQRMSVPPTVGRLESAEGVDLGAADNLRLLLLGRWRARGERQVVFRLRADDGCRLFVDGRLVIDYPGVHSLAQQAVSEPLELTAGQHEVLLDYFEWGGEAGVEVEWAPAGGGFEPLRSGDVLP